MNLLHPTKQKIIETAIELFSESGFNAVSIRDITQAVGIKESTLYYHFKNKQELLHVILDMFQHEIRKVCPPIEELDHLLSTATPEQFLRRGLENYKAYICHHETMSKVSRILIMEQFAQPKARSIILDELFGHYLAFLEAVFEKYIKLGYIKDFPVKLLAAEYQYPIFSMITQYQIMLVDGRDTSIVEKLMEEHIFFFLQKVKTG